MATLSEIRISSWRLLFIASRSPHLVISPNIYNDRQKLKEYQGIRATEAFEYENMRNNFKYVITEKNEKLCQTAGIPGTQGEFSDIKLQMKQCELGN